jgi:hypothetical protein
MVLALNDKLHPNSEEPGYGGQDSPVLLPCVTPASIGLSQFGGKHPDDVDEKNKVELWEGGRLHLKAAP